MSIVKFKLVEEEGNQITDEMKEFFSVDENGIVGYNHDVALKALREERTGRRADRKELAAYKGLNVTPDAIQAFLDLGKTPEELLAMIEAAATNGSAAEKLTEAEKARLTAEKDLRSLKSEFDKLKSKVEESDRKAAEADLRAKCEGLIDQLATDIDRDKARLWLLGGKTADGLDVKGTYHGWKQNAIGDLEDINSVAPLNYLTAMCKALGYTKTSTAGKADPGNATMQTNGSAAFATAQKNGDVQGMLANAPEAQ